jgi:hypothetical protein
MSSGGLSLITEHSSGVFLRLFESEFWREYYGISERNNRRVD